MNKQNFYIETAAPENAPELLKIYAPYVTDTAITFEYEVPTQRQFAQRIEKTLLKYPWIMIRSQNCHGEILGYAYAGTFHERAAYQWAVETSIYVKNGCTGMGIGRTLHNALENILTEQNILNMNACIAYPTGQDPYLNTNSALFHEHMGYRLVGEFYQCGYKFDRWYNMIWMEKHIGPHITPQPPVKSFNDIKDIIKSKYNIG